MTNTTRFALPLLAAAQAQKHVTVNEALARIDGLMQLTLTSVTLNTPPLTAQEGDCYGVGPAPVNDWAGQAAMIALYLNGGWVFVPPVQGMRAYVADQSGWAVFDGTEWVTGLVTLTPNGAGMVMNVTEIDHAIGAGASSAVSNGLPAQSVVFGITGRVISTITGSGTTGFSLGVAGSLNRYGSGLSVSQGSWLRGLTGTPVTYYANEDLILTAEGGDFTGGTLRLAVHFAQFALPQE